MPSSELAGHPYRKLTQVGWVRILRRSGELWLRNSANWPRNFGIRGASGGAIHSGVLLEAAGIDPSDCLLKTQVSAKT